MTASRPGTARKINCGNPHQHYQDHTGGHPVGGQSVSFNIARPAQLATTGRNRLLGCTAQASRRFPPDGSQIATRGKHSATGIRRGMVFVPAITPQADRGAVGSGGGA